MVLAFILTVVLHEMEEDLVGLHLSMRPLFCDLLEAHDRVPAVFIVVILEVHVVDDVLPVHEVGLRTEGHPLGQDGRFLVYVAQWDLAPLILEVIEELTIDILLRIVLDGLDDLEGHHSRRHTIPFSSPGGP